MIKRFAPEWNPTIKINRRGFRPLATGSVSFTGNFVKYLKATDILERGHIKKIRGVCSGSKVKFIYIYINNYNKRSLLIC